MPEKIIEKPWVVVHFGAYHSIERILEQEKNGLFTTHTERQGFDNTWNIKMAKIFKGIEEAIEYFSAKYYLSITAIKKEVFDRFPNIIKQEYLQRMCDSLTAYKDTLSQRQASCTENQEQAEKAPEYKYPDWLD